MGGNRLEQPAIKNMLARTDTTMATNMEGLVNQGAYKAIKKRLMTAPPNMLCMELYLPDRHTQHLVLSLWCMNMQ